MAALLLLGAPAAAAQQPTSRWSHLTLEDGLSQSIAFDVVQDAEGFLWIATEDGLNRYDGYGFRQYFHDPDDPTSIAANYAMSLHLDRAGRLWVGTWGRGVSRYVPETDSFVHVPHEAGDPATLAGSEVNTIVEDRTGAIWIGTADGGISVLDPATGALSHHRHDPSDATSLASDVVSGIVEDADGELWIATGRGLDRFDRSTERFVHYDLVTGGARLDSIAVDRDGRIWLGGGDGTLIRFDPRKKAGITYPAGESSPSMRPDEPVSEIYADPSGDVWIGTDGSGLSRYDPETDSFVAYRYDPRLRTSLGGDRIRSVYRDRGGVLWVGTWGAGLSKMTPTAAAFAHHQHVEDQPDSLVDNVVFAIEEDRHGSIWIGTYGSGLDRFDPASQTFEHFPPRPEAPDGLSNGDVRALLEDSRGALWVGSFGGLNRRNSDGTFTRFLDDGEPGSLASNRIFTLFEDSGGTLWIGTYGAGLARFDRDAQTFAHLRHDPSDPSSLSDDDVRAIHEDAQGALWIGTWNGGLNRLDRRTGAFERYRPEPDDPNSLQSDAVFHIIEDDGGDLWLATRMGLARVDSRDPGAGFRHFTRDDGLPDNMVYGVVADDAGRIWLSTNRGLARFDPTDESVAVFDARDGLQSNEFNAGAYTRIRSGALIFGGVNGFNVFDPSELAVDAAPPDVVVTAVRRFHGDMAETLRMPADGPLNLSYEDDFVSFEFAALDFAVPERNAYAYYLEGTNETWVDLGTRRDITFADLSHGEHVLHVRSTSGVGAGTGDEIQIQIAVSRPPWATTWFRGLLAVLVLAIAVGIHRLSTAAIRARAERLQVEVERERLQVHLQQAQRLEAVGQLTGGLAHDFNNLLTVIVGSLELMNETADDEGLAREAMVAANRGADLTQRLLAFSRQQTLRPRPVDLRELVSGMESLLRRTLGATIDIERVDEPDLWICEVDPAQVENALLNLCLNARDAMPDGGRITIRTENVAASRGGTPEAGTRDHVALVVKDEGVGIPADVLSKVFDPFFTTKEAGKGSGLGLSMVYGFVTQSGGRVTIDSVEGAGASVRLEFTRSSESAPSPTAMAVVEPPAGHGELVLVVEDDPAVRSLAVTLLERLGYRTLQAESGPAALRSLKRCDDRVDLVLTDVVLPGGMDGFELAREVRRDHPDMRVLFTSGFARDVELEHGGLGPEDKILPKPFTRETLAGDVAEALQAPRRT